MKKAIEESVNAVISLIGEEHRTLITNFAAMVYQMGKHEGLLEAKQLLSK